MFESGANWKILVALLVAISLVTGFLFFIQADGSVDGTKVANGDAGNAYMSSFSDYDELQEYLNTTETYYGSYSGSGSSGSGTWSSTGSPMLLGGSSSSYDNYAPTYSSTNVQVSGVDEEDMVKTDGKYIYLAHVSQVDIFKAYPPTELGLVKSIDINADARGVLNFLNGLSIAGLYCVGSDNLVVICEAIRNEIRWSDQNGSFQNDSWMFNGPISIALVYDVSDHSEPKLKRAFGISGSMETSRLIDDTIYIVASSSVNQQNNRFSIPTVWMKNKHWLMEPERIIYNDESNTSHWYLNVMAAEVDGHSIGYVSTVADYSSATYMSGENLFVTFNTQSSFWNPGNTTICRISVDGTELKVDARGEVTGGVLNQFSMDEKDGNLRIATTSFVGGVRSNNVYVLTSSLNVIGSLENLAEGERIYSTRFIGNTLYMVTYYQVDPFFVIDLSDPTNPVELGQLKIPGFSTYLHPIDEYHVLGIGSSGNSVKLTLFDVSDPANPTEDCTYEFEDYDYSSSNAQYDHKAVLYNGEEGILAIPIVAYNYSQSGYNYYYYSYTRINGMAVLDISNDSGISLRGIIEHNRSADAERAIYIGEYIYTISETQINACKMSDLSLVATVHSEYNNNYYYYY